MLSRNLSFSGIPPGTHPRGGGSAGHSPQHGKSDAARGYPTILTAIQAHLNQYITEGHRTHGQDLPHRRVATTPTDRQQVPILPGIQVYSPAQRCTHLDTAVSPWRAVGLTWGGAGWLGTGAVGHLTIRRLGWQCPWTRGEADR